MYISGLHPRPADKWKRVESSRLCFNKLIRCFLRCAESLGAAVFSGGARVGSKKVNRWEMHYHLFLDQISKAKEINVF